MHGLRKLDDTFQSSAHASPYYDINMPPLP